MEIRTFVAGARSRGMPNVSHLRAALMTSATRARRIPTPDGGRRAAIAAIFREADDGEQSEVLFIRRQERDGDPWSGHVAMPGGKHEGSDVDDEYTAMRETLEEVGLDLSDSATFERFGRLVDDRIVRSRGRTMVTGMFGFAVRPGPCPPLAPQEAEVADAWWVDSQLLRCNRLGWRVVDIEEWGSAVRNRPWLVSLLRNLHVDQVRFAAIDMPLPPGTAPAEPAPADGVASNSSERRPAAALAQQSKQYQLWGLTLAFYSDLLRTSGAGQPLIGEGAPPAFHYAIAPGAAGGALGKFLVGFISFAATSHAAKARAVRRLGLWCGMGLAGMGLTATAGLVLSRASSANS